MRTIGFVHKRLIFGEEESSSVSPGSSDECIRHAVSAICATKLVQDLHAFADLVMQREKEGLTLSYIKNVIWQAERGLGQETPLESLLTQYQDARAQGQNTDTLEKQINERLDGVVSRWLLLKNNVMPETATDIKPEK